MLQDAVLTPVIFTRKTYDISGQVMEEEDEDDVFVEIKYLDNLDSQTIAAHKKQHGKYLAKTFKLACHNIFNDFEYRLLLGYGAWMQALADDNIQPFTCAQEHFVQVAKGLRNPETKFERIWIKYCRRLQWEKANGLKYLDMKAMPLNPSVI